MSDNKSLHSKFQEYKCCVIIPTYNNAGTLVSVIEDVKRYTSNLIVVNDGSTDDTSSLLENQNDIHLIGYKQNKGKGFALKYAFKYALKQGFKYAITLDSDGQHLAKDLVKFIDCLPEKRKSIIIGARNMDQESVPGKSSFGNKFSSFWIRVETGVKLPDTQSGYRLYPIWAMRSMKYYWNKFEFEVEVLVKSFWNGIQLDSIPVEVYYAPQEERVSHFRPFKDFTRISILNTILVTLAIVYYWPRNAFRKYSKKNIRAIIKEDILGSEEPNGKLALAIGFGIFMGILPVWGYQLIIGFTLAHLMKINKAIFFLFANISIPPMIPFILYFSFLFGGFLLGDQGVDFSFSDKLSLQLAFTHAKQYIIGAIALAIASGISAFSVSYLLLLLFRRK